MNIILCWCPLQIAVQMAVVFAKVARVDYPKAWPSLFTDLLQQMQGQNTLVVRRVYLVLHHALKELASKRLGSDQKAFAEVMPVCYSSRPPLPVLMHQHEALAPKPSQAVSLASVSSHVDAMHACPFNCLSCCS